MVAYSVPIAEPVRILPHLVLSHSHQFAEFVSDSDKAASFSS